MRDISSKKTQADLESAQVLMKKKEEELTSAKDALSVKQLISKKLGEENKAMKLEHAKRSSALEAPLEKLRGDRAFLAKDVEDSRSTAMAAIKRAEDPKPRALEVQSRLSQLVGMFNQFKKEWPEEYFEGLSVGTPGDTSDAENDGGEAVEWEVVAVNDEATS
ncbi:hypothetical protein LIER_27158 [Lithospermum erythrorhizon]|uniref:Uncharacterized protein n=1 Tax=Lithospermum erythrorhizon TaxID=34254 RepID=A0AAV3REN9_LITER